MKKLFLIVGLLLPLMVITFSSNSQSTTPQNPKIGTFELYRTITENDITSYFGIFSKADILKNENEKGEDVDVKRYLYYRPNSSRVAFEISIMEDRIEGFGINVRDPKYAINGKLMVGDNISKVSELGYKVINMYRGNGKIVYPPTYKRGALEICYYFEVYCDTNNVITSISISEDTGV